MIVGKPSTIKKQVRLLVVNSCRECPRFWEGYCRATHQPIPDMEQFPDFCPLEKR